MVWRGSLQSISRHRKQHSTRRAPAANTTAGALFLWVSAGQLREISGGCGLDPSGTSGGISSTTCGGQLPDTLTAGAVSFVGIGGSSKHRKSRTPGALRAL